MARTESVGVRVRDNDNRPCVCCVFRSVETSHASILAGSGNFVIAATFDEIAPELNYSKSGKPCLIVDLRGLVDFFFFFVKISKRLGNGKIVRTKVEVIGTGTAVRLIGSKLLDGIKR